MALEPTNTTRPLALIISADDTSHTHSRSPECSCVVQLRQPVIHLLLVISQERFLETPMTDKNESIFVLLVSGVKQCHCVVSRHQSVWLELIKRRLEDDWIAIMALLDMLFELVHQIFDPSRVPEEIKLCASKYGSPFLPWRSCFL